MMMLLLTGVVLLLGVTVLTRPPLWPPQWKAAMRRMGVHDERVEAAMDRVRRADFLPWGVRLSEYEDRPLPLGHGQTTSQPSLIGEMLAALELRPTARVLEVGTGCGYQTALLAELAEDVYSIDVVEPLVRWAERRLVKKGYRVHLRVGDGYLGWPEAAPFDGIVVCASAPLVPAPLLEQLAPGGRLVIPVGSMLERYTKTLEGTVKREELLPVAFVPFTGERASKDRQGGPG